MSRVNIRRMEECDLDAVADLEKICFSRPWSADLLKESVTSPFDKLYIADIDGHVCGYSNLRVVADEGEIERVAVYPGIRRHGLGSRLMEEMIRSASKTGVSYITLEVRTGNEPAISLYRSFGFEKIGTRKNYYQDPTEDAYVMRRMMGDESSS